MNWYITIDNIDGGDSLDQWNGSAETLEEAKKVCVHAFRMLDDDGEVYYHGKSSDADSEDAFAPLDDFGMPNAGCTDIQYFEKGKWCSL